MALIGSIRMIVDVYGNVAGYNDYYPYGETMPGRSGINGGVDPRYNFTGKERDAAETGYDYFGARYYDSWSGRWMQVDPLAEKYPGWSPYAYSADNAISIFDIDGMKWVPAVKRAEAQIGYAYANGLSFTTKGTYGLNWTDLNNSCAECSDVGARAYKPDFPDFPGDMNGQYNWFNSQGWFTTDITKAGEGDIVFFGDPSKRPHHEIMITAVKTEKDVKTGKVVLKFRILGASSGAGRVKEYDGYYTWEEIKNMMEKSGSGSFYGIGSVQQTQNKTASNSTSSGDVSSTSNDNSSTSSNASSNSDAQQYFEYMYSLLTHLQ